jgi:hypothetical protein
VYSTCTSTRAVPVRVRLAKWSTRASEAPAKVVAFSWTLLLDRIPTKANLAYRGLLGANESKRCVFCGSQDELAVHLFLHCDMISGGDELVEL